MLNILDGCVEDGPLLTSALSKPKAITKAQIQKCISQFPRWDDEQLEAVVSRSKPTACCEGRTRQSVIEDFLFYKLLWVFWNLWLNKHQ